MREGDPAAAAAGERGRGEEAAATGERGRLLERGEMGREAAERLLHTRLTPAFGEVVI